MIGQELARSIRIVGLDVDGVMTDGGIYLGDTGGIRSEFKRYDVQDGLGLYLLRAAGIRLAIVTGRVSESVRLRALELDIDDVVQDPSARKLPAFTSLLAGHGVTLAESAFVGDDLPDLPVLRSVGMPVAVGNAVAEVRAACTVQLQRHGGRGALREFAELLLRARGDWDRVADDYVRERSQGRAGHAPFSH
ncbi:MAG: HAD hydrolase family protein [Gemmatimonadaceae bacterium]